VPVIAGFLLSRSPALKEPRIVSAIESVMASALVVAWRSL